MIDEREVTVPVCYRLWDGNDVGFVVGRYDPTVPLTIDPQLLYSTYLGGLDNEDGNRITLDPAGNIYVTGTTSSPDFPVTPDAESPDYSESATGSSQMFVTKLDATTHQIVYSTYLGGGVPGGVQSMHRGGQQGGQRISHWQDQFRGFSDHRRSLRKNRQRGGSGSLCHQNRSVRLLASVFNRNRWVNR
ncbi:SBBP repeat-containing protein [Methanogenium cariaci]|uniref:SBBP repeat-containing protein n=1 Tax=Methanogenium cariaci TaxID=2197 RepID=UPI0007811EAE|nr:SBBP repeat-containing protein [Methanogenium cariaci]